MAPPCRLWVCRLWVCRAHSVSVWALPDPCHYWVLWGLMTRARSIRPLAIADWTQLPAPLPSSEAEAWGWTCQLCRDDQVFLVTRPLLQPLEECAKDTPGTQEVPSACGALVRTWGPRERWWQQMLPPPCYSGSCKGLRGCSAPGTWDEQQIELSHSVTVLRGD